MEHATPAHVEPRPSAQQEEAPLGLGALAALAPERGVELEGPPTPRPPRESKRKRREVSEPLASERDSMRERESGERLAVAPPDAIASRSTPTDAVSGASPEPEASEEEPLRIDWERWIGVRGAAALGAGILVIALFYFLRYSIEEGWLTIAMRVLLGAGVSAACLAVAQLRLKKTHTVLANWLTGAGIAGLYASIWAAQNLAGMIGPVVAFAMVVTLTAGALALAIRSNSLPIALLGLSGGFAAPLSLSLEGAAPLAVIAYVTILDGAMVTLSIKKGWWSLSFLSLAVSALYEGMWMHADPARSDTWHIGVLVILAGVFGAAPAFAMGEADAGKEAPEPLARLTRYGAVLLPLAFAARLALASNQGSAPFSWMGLGAVVIGMAAVIARRRNEPALPLVAALGYATVVFLWIVTNDAVNPWLAGLTVLVTSAPLLFLAYIGKTPFLLDPESGEDERAGTLEVSSFALFQLVAAALMVLEARSPEAATACFATVGVLFGSTLWLARSVKAPTLASGALVSGALATGAIALASRQISDAVSLFAGAEASSREIVALSASILAAGGFVAFARRSEDTVASILSTGVRITVFLLLGLLALSSNAIPFVPYAGFAAALATLLVLSDKESGLSYSVIGFTMAAVFAMRAWLHTDDTTTPTLVAATIGLAIAAAPVIDRLGLLTTHRGPRGQALTLLAFALALAPRWIFADILPLGAATGIVAGLAAVLLAADLWRAPSVSVRESAAGWLGTIAVLGSTLTVLVSLDREYVAWGLAAIGLALVAIYKRTGRNLLLVTGLVHIAAASTRLLLHPHVLSFHARGAIPVLDWITPAFLVTAACAFGAWRLANRGGSFDAGARKVAAALGFVLTFAWVNVAVLDVFAAGKTISFDTDAPQARDLAMSFAWALFGIGLLVLGMRRNAGALRKTSLALILLTAAKVFLYDLATLANLYRVASLVGLAVSLLGISVLYQRFVFKKPQEV